MKRLLIAGLATVLAVGFLFAQGSLVSGDRRWTAVQTYDAKSPPPLPLPEAYALALAHIGPASNSFYCVRASCLELTNHGFTGWTFSFASTNGQKGRVVVYFDREVQPWLPGGVRLYIDK